MQHITGISRQQMRFSSLEDSISPDNQVRFIDAFVEYIDISKLNFAVKTLKTEGRPSFNSKLFLKIYLYGYLNRVRSGRDLEKECLRNMEMQWLLEDIRPNYHSFRSNYPPLSSLSSPPTPSDRESDECLPITILSQSRDRSCLI